MMPWVALGMAVQATSRNKLRSGLTTLGVVIGVAAVIAMVHLGESTKYSVTQQIASLGQNLLTVRPGARGRGPGGTRDAAEPFTIDDVAAIERDLTDATVAPVASQSALLVAGNANWPSAVNGVTNAFFDVRDWEVSEGRAFEPAEQRAGASVCILGETVRKELFPQGDAVGSAIRVGSLSCQVVGVLESKQAMIGDQDDIVLIPLRTVQKRLIGETDVTTIFVEAPEGTTTTTVKAELERLLRERRRIRNGNPDDFNVSDMAEIAARVQSTTQSMTLLLGAIAAVSLLVGGIGIMNIMLVSVTERTRELGVRMAVGARGGEVMSQILVESALLSTVGGVVGILMGLGGSYVTAQKLQMPFVVVPGIVALAFFFSAAVGVIFGIVPARKAASLDPIEALRHE